MHPECGVDWARSWSCPSVPKVERRNILAHLGLRISRRFQYRHESRVVAPSTRIDGDGPAHSPFPAEPRSGNPSPPRGASQLVHVQDRTRTQPGRLHRPGKPGDGVPEPAEDQVRGPEGARAAGREGEADRQEGLRRLEPVSQLHGPVPRGGHRADRDPQAVARPARTRPTSAWSSTRWTSPGASPTSTPS